MSLEGSEALKAYISWSIQSDPEGENADTTYGAKELTSDLVSFDVPESIPIPDDYGEVVWDDQASYFILYKSIILLSLYVYL